MKSPRDITPQDIVVVRAEDVTPGMITADGIVLNVEPSGARRVGIEHRSSVYMERRDAPVEVYGRISDALLAIIQDAIRTTASVR